MFVFLKNALTFVTNVKAEQMVKVYGRIQTSTEDLLKINAPATLQELARLKMLKGRKKHNTPIGTFFTCHNTSENLTYLKKWGYTETHQQTIPKKIKNLKADLRQFQWWGVWMLHHLDGSALLADDMGLGKTLQAIAYLLLHPEQRPAVVVCPAFLKLNWAAEISKFTATNQSVQILSGSPKKIKGRNKVFGDIIIINYEILANDYIKRSAVYGKKRKPLEVRNTGWVDFLCKKKPEILFLDEAHYIKTNKSQRTKAVKRLAKISKRVTAITGTPIENAPMDVFTAVSIINPSIFSSRRAFGMRYCDGKHNGYAWTFNGSSNLDELYQILTSTVMIRRLKAHHLKELPPKVYRYIPIELVSRAEYDKAEKNIIHFLKETMGDAAAKRAQAAKALTEIEILKQLAVKHSLKHSIQWIANFLESGEKLIVFATHKFVIDAVCNTFPDIVCRVDGKVSNKGKQQAKEIFQTNPDKKLFVGNIKAAGVGLTLTAASSVLVLELPWNPGALAQAEDRAHRITQTKQVTINFAIPKDTIMEKIAQLIDAKLKTISQAIDGEEADPTKLLGELLESLLVKD